MKQAKLRFLLFSKKINEMKVFQGEIYVDESTEKRYIRNWELCGVLIKFINIK